MKKIDCVSNITSMNDVEIIWLKNKPYKFLLDIKHECITH